MPTARATDRAALLRQIIELLAQTGPGQPTAVGVVLDGDDIELAVKPLECGDVVRSLAGFRAPHGWTAFAVVASATAQRLDGSWSGQVVLGALAARDGLTTSAIVGLDDPQARDDGEGRILDACRRVLGLPTDPPVVAPAWWAATHWVDAIVAAVVGADLGATPSWPALRALDTGAIDAHRSWSALRRRCATGRVRIPGIDAQGAAWMDDGMFSREALSAYPSLTALVADLRELLPWSTYEAVLEALCDRLEHATGKGSVNPS
jgi:hypothetical protein